MVCGMGSMGMLGVIVCGLLVGIFGVGKSFDTFIYAIGIYCFKQVAPKL